MPRGSNKSNIEANESSARARNKFEEKMGRENLPLHLALSRGELGKIQSNSLTFDFSNPAHLLLFALFTSMVFVDPVSASKSPKWEEEFDLDGYPVDPEDAQPTQVEASPPGASSFEKDYFDLTAAAFEEMNHFEEMNRGRAGIADIAAFLLNPFEVLKSLSKSLLGEEDYQPLPETHDKKKEAGPVLSSVKQKALDKKSNAAIVRASVKAVPLRYNNYRPEGLERIVEGAMSLVRSQSELMKSVFEKFKPKITLEAPEGMSDQAIARLLKSALSQYCSEFVGLFKDNIAPDTVEIVLIHRAVATQSPLPIASYYRWQTILPYAIGKDGEAVFSLGQVAKAIMLSYFKANGKFPSPQDVEKIVAKGCDSRGFYQKLAECVSAIVAKEVRGEEVRKIYELCATVIMKYLDGASPHVSLSKSFVANIEEKEAIEKSLEGIVSTEEMKGSRGLFQVSFKIPENMGPLESERINGIYRLYLTSLLVTESNGRSNVKEQLDLLIKQYPDVKRVIGNKKDFVENLEQFDDFFALTRSRIFAAEECRGAEVSDASPELTKALGGIFSTLNPTAPRVSALAAQPSSSARSDRGDKSGIKSVKVSNATDKGRESNA